MGDGGGGRGFLCAPGLKIEAQERLSELQFAQIKAQLEQIEESVKGVEKRLWLIASGVVGVVLIEAVSRLVVVGA